MDAKKELKQLKELYTRLQGSITEINKEIEKLQGTITTKTGEYAELKMKFDVISIEYCDRWSTELIKEE